MKYIIGALSALFLVPMLAFAQAGISISGAVQTETSENGRVRFTYQIQEESELILKTECNGDGRFFVEKTGAVIECGDEYTVSNAGTGGRLEIIPYEIKQDMRVTHTLVQKKKDGSREDIVKEEVNVDARDPQPIFTHVSVRQPDPVKANILVNWSALERSEVSLYLECESSALVLRDKSGKTYSCNQEIASWPDMTEGEMTFTASNHSTQEGLLFSFIAEKEGNVGMRKNLSFTFETTTEVGDGVTNEQSIINRLWAQVQAMLAVIAALFK